MSRQAELCVMAMSPLRWSLGYGEEWTSSRNSVE
ncbi:hypothetical protein M758_9G086800 [Ceratodon purpureus]|nr:hypothetical protein M758_9G086800 [Ceratodon purpureus]